MDDVKHFIHIINDILADNFVLGLDIKEDNPCLHFVWLPEGTIEEFKSMGHDLNGVYVVEWKIKKHCLLNLCTVEVDVTIFALACSETFRKCISIYFVYVLQLLR